MEKTNAEKRKAGDYEILESVFFDQTEFIIGENTKAAIGERYISAEGSYIWTGQVNYDKCVLSDSFAEIMRIFAGKLSAAAKELLYEQHKTARELGITDETECLTRCKPVTHDDCLLHKIVLIKPECLSREYQGQIHELHLCVGGFGTQPNARGQACFCKNLYTGKDCRFDRSEILGTMEKEDLPEWAREKYEKLLTERNKGEDFSL